MKIFPISGLVALCLTVSACQTTSPQAAPTSNQPVGAAPKIVNMSKHDFDTIKNLKVDAPDYKSWKNEGVELVIFRATCGDGTDQYKKNGFPDIDPSFSKEIQKASAAGLHVGAYHLLRSGQDSKEQARFFHKTVTRALRNDNNARNSGLILALDIGVPASTEAAHPHGSTPDEIALFILEMNNLLRMDGSNSSAGVLGIYPENKYTAKIPNGNGGKKEIKSDFLRNLRNAKEPARTTIQDCWLWGSDYRQREPDFTNSYGLWGKVATLHQYSGGREDRKSVV